MNEVYHLCNWKTGGKPNLSQMINDDEKSGDAIV